MKRGRYAPLVMWVVSLLAFAVVFAEAMLRLYKPTMSYQFSRLSKLPEYIGVDPKAIADEHVSFNAGDSLSVWCGLIGTGLMVIAAVYPIFRRIKLFRWLASNTMWFDFHLMAGIVGPMFVALHSVLKLDTWVSAAFWSMVIVVISGFLGRYLYTLVPSLSSGVELEELDHERAFQAARAKYPGPMAERRSRADRATRECAAGRAVAAASRGRSGWLISQDIGRFARTLARRGRLARNGDGSQDPRATSLAAPARMIVIARKQVVAPKAQLLLHSWKKVHVPFTVFLTAFAVAHIWDAWSRAW